MYFVIVKDIATGQIVDKAELQASVNTVDNLLHRASQIRKQFESRYPAAKYTITFEEAESWEQLQSKFKEDSSEDGKVFTMTGSRASLIIVNVIAMIAGTALLFVLLLIRLLYNPFIFILGIIILFTYFFFDCKRWMKKGIQKVRIDDDGITFFRGAEKIPTRIDKRQITGVNVFKKLNRKVVNILLGGYADSSLVGVTLFTGPRVRITNDAFQENEFTIFIQKIYELTKR